MELPPIMRTRGLRLIEIGEDEHGSYLKFAANRSRVREVTVYLLPGTRVHWQFVYAMWDSSTRTVTTYQGQYGDPEKDERLNMRGA